MKTIRRLAEGWPLFLVGLNSATCLAVFSGLFSNIGGQVFRVCCAVSESIY